MSITPKLEIPGIQSVERSSSLPKSTNFPISVKIEFLENVTQSDAAEYALGALKSTHTSGRLFYGVFPLGSGFIVELQEGGTGFAYTPTLLTALKEVDDKRDLDKHPLKAVIRSGTGHLYISLKGDSLTSLELPQGRHLDVELNTTPSASKLTKAFVSHSRRLLGASAVLLVLSFVAYLLAAFSVADSPSLEVEKINPQETALHQWNSKFSWADSEKPTKIEKLEGKWTLTTTPIAPQPPLTEN